MPTFRDALSAYSAYLGDKPFLLGDRPCLADLSIFGFVCLSVCLPDNTKSAYRPHIREKCENLLRHRQRMIKEYWPDFDDCVFGCEKDKKEA